MLCLWVFVTYIHLQHEGTKSSLHQKTERCTSCVYTVYQSVSHSVIRCWKWSIMSISVSSSEIFSSVSHQSAELMSRLSEQSWINQMFDNWSKSFKKTCSSCRIHWLLNLFLASWLNIWALNWRKHLNYVLWSEFVDWAGGKKDVMSPWQDGYSALLTTRQVSDTLTGPRSNWTRAEIQKCLTAASRPANEANKVGWKQREHVTALTARLHKSQQQRSSDWTQVRGGQ